MAHLQLPKRLKESGSGLRFCDFSQTYDLADHVKSLTYPSTRTVNYSYDTAGRLSSFTGNLGYGTQRNYATSISYGSSGAWTREEFGTTPTTLYNKRFYNNRQQLHGIVSLNCERRR